ncbi:hypothetical protein OCK74_17590 [Chitinophagaceae bacterium LB-8]|uniref:DUF748 domain-containing protein n=1 Tax=Paraflavisolibacter caeni TaxID=2982496 RepID=A0A9X2Y0N9_9BACT|nr:hypothetical protein [Paraflavisolibacter caeni]MCU7550938.1 hypothetical protein [Paraflavisolibacter caeni]
MKKLYILLLIIGGFVIAAYLFTRFSLKADIRQAGAIEDVENSAFAAPAKNLDTILDLRPLFKKRLQQLVKDGSKGLYDLTMDSMVVDVLESTVTLMNVKLSPDKNALAALDNSKQAPDDVFAISLRSIKLNGINIDDVMNNKTMTFNSLNIIAPFIEIYHQKRAYNKRKSMDTENLYQRIKQHIQKLAVTKLTVEGGSVISYDVKNKNKKTKFNDVVLRFHDILIDSTTQNSTDRFLFAKRALLTMRNYATRSADNLYRFKIATITIEAPKRLMTLDNVSLSSEYKKQEHKKGVLYQPELYDLSIPRILVHNIDWWSFMNKERCIADKVDISNPRLKVSMDRSLPSKPKESSFLNQLLMKLPMQVYLKRLNVRNLDLTYEEYNPVSKQKGFVYFSNVYINSSHLTNMKQYIRQKRQANVNASGKLMRQMPITASLTFDLVNYKSGNFSADFNVAGFNGSLVNSFAMPLGLFKVEKGRLENTKVHIQGNEYKTTGKILMRYNDLKLSLYEKEKDEQGLDKKGLIGLFANTFIIKNNNPQKNEPPREPIIEFQPSPNPGFSNLVWKTILTGILETIGANPKLASKQ